MMTKKIQAYGCNHCGMTSLRRSSVVRHEVNSCRSSPDRKSCATCKNLAIDAIGDYKYNYSERYCNTDSTCFVEDSVNINSNNDCPDFIHKLGDK